MSQKPETTFYTGVHKYLPTDLHREKMCNPFAGGTWDFWFSGERDLWVEYKFVVLPKRAETMVDITLSELQKEWGRGRLAEGRNLAVIVGCKEGGVILRDREWEYPMAMWAFKERLQSRINLANTICILTKDHRS